MRNYHNKCKRICCDVVRDLADGGPKLARDGEKVTFRLEKRHPRSLR